MKDKKPHEAIQDQFQAFIGLFKALANDERLQIVALLSSKGEMCPQEIEQYFFLEQSTTSHHLNVLHRAEITTSRREGRNIYYALNREFIQGQCHGFLELFTLPS